MLTQEAIKEKVGKHAVSFVKEHTIIGIGTGSTAYHFINALGNKVKEGFSIRAIPTSEQSKLQAESLSIPLIEFNDVSAIDLVIDGADEIDHQLQMIKGGGGALLQEKIVASAAKQYIIIGDQSKLVTQLGAFPLPVEVIPFAWKHIQMQIMHNFTIEVKLRIKDQKPYVTDHKHFILDCHFNQIHDPAAIHRTLKNIPGIVEDGLFINMADIALIGMEDGSIFTISKNKKTL